MLDIKQVGKISLEARYKKDQAGCDVKKFAEILNSKDLDIIASYESEGKTTEGFEFASIRFYFKKKEVSNV